MGEHRRPPSGSKQRGRRSTPSAWLRRQLADPYVAAARRLGYRSRAAFKLIELDDRFQLLRPGAWVVDLGAAPGGWTQVAVARIGAGPPEGGRVVAVDRLPMEPVPGVSFVQVDFLEQEASSTIEAQLPGKADVVLSDMAPMTTGHSAADHVRIMELAEAAWALAAQMLKPGGSFVCKLFQGGGARGFVDELRRRFSSVRFAKPPSSRSQSAEIYVVARGFRGRQG
jgi:23S rRNA (uridine2552-2'-O)-methyltransferase